MGQVAIVPHYAERLKARTDMPYRLMREPMFEEPCEEGADYGPKDCPEIRRSSNLDSMCGAAKVQEVFV